MSTEGNCNCEEASQPNLGQSSTNHIPTNCNKDGHCPGDCESKDDNIELEVKSRYISSTPPSESNWHQTKIERRRESHVFIDDKNKTRKSPKENSEIRTKNITLSIERLVDKGDKEGDRCSTIESCLPFGWPFNHALLNSLSYPALLASRSAGDFTLPCLPQPPPHFGFHPWLHPAYLLALQSTSSASKHFDTKVSHQGAAAHGVKHRYSPYKTVSPRQTSSSVDKLHSPEAKRRNSSDSHTPNTDEMLTILPPQQPYSQHRFTPSESGSPNLRFPRSANHQSRPHSPASAALNIGSSSDRNGTSASITNNISNSIKASSSNLANELQNIERMVRGLDRKVCYRTLSPIDPSTDV